MFQSLEGLAMHPSQGGLPPVEVTPPWVTSSDLNAAVPDTAAPIAGPELSSKVGSMVPASHPPSSWACCTYQTHCSWALLTFPPWSPSLPTSLSCLSPVSPEPKWTELVHSSLGGDMHVQRAIGRGELCQGHLRTDPVMPKIMGSLVWGRWLGEVQVRGRRSAVSVCFCFVSFLLPYVFRDISWQNC